jgi:type II secretory pathway pseudopilin PulG
MFKKLKKKRQEILKGITLIEIVLTMAIITILAGLATPFYMTVQTKNDFEITVSTTAHKIRRAQFLAQSGDKDSDWGISIANEEITLFVGENYTSRNSNYDEIYLLPPTIEVSGLTELIFNKTTGIPKDTGTITFTSNLNETRNITINTKGIISYD